MSGPRRSVGEYVADRVSQLQDLGALVRSITTQEFGSNDAVIVGQLEFGGGDLVQLTVFEHIRIGPDGRTPHRFKYSYNVAQNGKFSHRYDRDPTGHPETPEHMHTAESDQRRPCGRVTLHDVVDGIWGTLARRAVPPH